MSKKYFVEAGHLDELADCLDFHRLECNRLHLLLIDDASKGLDDVAAGQIKDAKLAIRELRRHRNV